MATCHSGKAPNLLDFLIGVSDLADELRRQESMKAFLSPRDLVKTWSRNISRAACAIAFLLLLASAHAGTIHLSAAGPSPSLLNVLTNEPVIFVADDEGPYAVTSFNWAAGTIYLPHQGSTGSVTLAFSGTYDYDDGQGGSGIIYVNIPPSCEITNPTNNAVFIAPASFDLTVDARDTDQDKLIGVDFWLDNTYLDGKLSQPFTVPVSNLGPGTHTLMAVAVDYGEAAVTNSITITVVQPSLSLLNARRIGGQFIFDVSGTTAGKSVVLETRSSLAAGSSWAPLRTNVAAGTSISLTNPISSASAIFRAYQLP
jgi:hypothetical protein